MTEEESFKQKFEAACAKIEKLQEELRNERRKREEAELRSTNDGLTGLLTRDAFDADGEPRYLRARRGGSLVTMVFIDANGFKTVNDTHGHETGDDLLRAIAEAIKLSKRPADLAGRKGGDEFLLFFEGATIRQTRNVADRLHGAVERIRLARIQDLRASVSIGAVVGIPDRMLNWKDLIGLADHAMYEAKKHKGTNQPTICIRPLDT